MEADYTDTYTATIRNVHRMTARDLFQLMFVYYPKPILYMLKLRDWLVKTIGLQGGGGFTELIREEDEKNHFWKIRQASGVSGLIAVQRTRC